MRPEHSETKAKTEPRECETETSTVRSIAVKSNTNRYVSFFITHMRLMMNRKWIWHLR